MPIKVTMPKVKIMITRESVLVVFTLLNVLINTSAFFCKQCSILPVLLHSNKPFYRNFALFKALTHKIIKQRIIKTHSFC